MTHTIVHTSDWHLGQRLCGQERAAEHAVFLEWLLQLLERRRADALLVSGDVFDAANPPVEAMAALFRFLLRARERCPGIVVIGGNHDSSGRLDAFAPLLAPLGVHLVGSLPRERAACVVPLADREGRAFARVAAVPYLHPSDLAAAPRGEAAGEAAGRVAASIAALYGEVLAVARRQLGPLEALVVMGHLVAEGGAATPGSERPIQAHEGLLRAVPAAVFPVETDYAALGHLHRPQRVAGRAPLVYSGAPIPLSFGEAGYRHSVSVVRLDTDGRVAGIETAAAPRAVAMHDVEGEWDEVRAQLARLKEELAPAGDGGGGGGGRAWVRVSVRLREPVAGLRDEVLALAEGSGLSVLAVRRLLAPGEGAAEAAREAESLEELTPAQVFRLKYRSLFRDADPPPAVAAAFEALVEEALREREERQGAADAEAAACEEARRRAGETPGEAGP